MSTPSKPPDPSEPSKPSEPSDPSMPSKPPDLSNKPQLFHCMRCGEDWIIQHGDHPGEQTVPGCPECFPDKPIRNRRYTVFHLAVKFDPDLPDLGPRLSRPAHPEAPS